ncbi:MAG: hypothetical protein ACXWMU_01455 [Candidatus Limnocylindrales bacterium]
MALLLVACDVAPPTTFPRSPTPATPNPATPTPATATPATPSRATPTPVSLTQGALLVLAGPAGARRVHVVPSAGGLAPLPDVLPGSAASASWLSVAPDGRLALTLAERRSVVLGRIRADGSLELGPATLIDAPGLPAAGRPTWFGSWSPAGDRLAFLAVDLALLAPQALVVTDPGPRPAWVLALPGQAEAAAPTWLDGGRVIVLTRDPAERVGTATVEVATGRILSSSLLALYGLARSGDGTAVALAPRDEAAVHVGSLATWLGSGEIPPDAVSATDRDAVATALALDATGRRLAVAWQRGVGATTVRVYERDAGWREVASTPFTDGVASLAWLP